MPMSIRRPTAIILEPAKDLAEQTDNFVSAFAKFLTNPQLRNELFIGGPAKPQHRVLAEGVDIVTGTPGQQTPSK